MQGVIVNDNEDDVVFAYLPDAGYFYPARVLRRNRDSTDIQLLSGENRRIKEIDLLPSDVSINDTDLECNRGRNGVYYACKLAFTEDNDLVVAYESDGFMEAFRMDQLRLNYDNKNPSVIPTDSSANEEMSLMFCQECGKKIQSTAKFCKFCGASTVDDTLTASTQEQSYEKTPEPSDETVDIQKVPDDPEEALAFYLDRLHIMERIYDQSGSIDDLVSASNFCYRVWSTLIELGRKAEALEYIKKDIDIRMKTYGHNDEDDDFLRLSYSFLQFAIIQDEIGQQSDAWEYYQHDVDLIEKQFYKECTEEMLKRLNLSVSTIHTFLTDRGFTDKAREFGQRYLAAERHYNIQTGAAEAPPDEDDDDDEDALVFAHWSNDGCYYPATIEARYTDDTVDLQYMDGVERNAGLNELISLMDALKSENLQGNWGNGGIYYACNLHRITEDNNIEVIYKMDGVFEKLSISQLRIKGKKQRRGLFG